MKPSVFLLTAMLLSFVTVSADAGPLSLSIKGKVKDKQGQPVPAALVVLLSQEDSTVLNFTYADTSGLFSMDMRTVPDTPLIVEISSMGYEKVRLTVTPPSSNLVVTLEASSETLAQVVVTSDRGTVSKRPGKLVYTPPAETASAMDAFSMLGYAPLVTVSREAVTVLGNKRAEIWVDGRKPVMSQEAAMDILRNTPAEKIEKIEVITSPGASYKASSGAVINVVYKKEPGQGLDGSASLRGTYYARKVSPETALGLNWAGRKLTVSGNLGFVNSGSRIDQTEQYSYFDTGQDIGYRSSLRSDLYMLHGNLNLSCDINSVNLIGASVALDGDWTDIRNEILTDYLSDGILTRSSLVSSITGNPEIKPGLGAEMYYNLKTDTYGSNLDISANYSSYYDNSRIRTEITSQSPRSWIQQTVSDFRAFEAKAVYRHVFADGSSLSSGLEHTSTLLSNDFFRDDSTGWNNTFLYNEHISHAYISYDRQWNEVLWTTAGLRGEYTHISGEQQVTGEKVRQSYFNLFPSVSVMLNLGEGKHSLMLDYRMNIDRPFYTSLNPFEIWTTENTYSTGNPQLGAALAHELMFNYTFFYDYMLGIMWMNSGNAVFDYDEYVGNGIMKSSTGNFGIHNMLHMTADINKRLFNGIWEIRLNATAGYENLEAVLGETDMSYSTWYWMADLRNTVNLSRQHGLFMTLSYSYNSPMRSLTWEVPERHYLNLSISKQFDFGGTLSLEATDLLGTFGPQHFSTATYTYHRDWQTWSGLITLSWRQAFGRKYVRQAEDRSAGNLSKRIR